MKRAMDGIYSLLILVVLALPAHAIEIGTTSKVTSVTVYPRLAAVTRSGTAKLPAGSQRIVIGNIPANFTEQSLRVQGKAKALVKIGSVEVKRIFTAELAAAAEQEKAKGLQAKRDEVAMIDAELKALQVRADFIENLANKKSSAADRSNMTMTVIASEKTSEMSPEKWTQAWSMIQSGMTETQKSIVTKEIAKRALQEEIAKLEREYQQIRTSQRERRDVIVNVDAAEETDFDFTVMYQTRGVSWQPLYDARLNTEKAELKLEQYGQVAQQTGEDWENVELTLSTSQPELGSEMPRIAEWYIHSGHKGRMQKLAPMNEPMISVMSDAAEGAGGNLLRGQAEYLAQPEPVKATPVSAEVADTDFAAEFRVPGRVDLKSVAEPAKFFISEQTMKTALSVQTTPRLGERAYLFAKIENADKFPVIGGNVAKYRDGAFMGNARLKMLRPGDTENLSFGVDDRVKVTFQKTDTKQSNPALVVIGDATLERAYKTKVKNLHKTLIKITVIDHYPVSRDPDIKVSLNENVTTKGYVKDTENRQGVITWEADCQPQEEKVYDIGFTVKYPKDKPVPNL